MDNPLAFMFMFTIATLVASSIWVILAPDRLQSWGYYTFVGATITFIAWGVLVIFILAVGSMVR